MANTTRQRGNQVARVQNKLPDHRYPNPVAPRPRNSRTPAARAFPNIGIPPQTVNTRYVGARETTVVKTVMDSQLKHVLLIFAVFISLSFAVGLVLWVMS